MFLPSVKRIRADWRVGPSKHAVALIPASSVSRIMSSGIPIEAAIPLATLMIQEIDRLDAALPAQRIPARRKLWINARWKTRNRIIRGAEVISAAAQITDQSIP
jgi:hypothetical protein